MARKSNKQLVEELKAENAQLKAENKKLKSKASIRSLSGRFNARQFVAYFLLSIAAFMSISTINLLFIRDNLLDTDTWVQNTTEIIQNEEVQDTISAVTTDALFEELDIEQTLSEALPERASFIATPIADSIRNFTYDSTKRIISSEEFLAFWQTLNREAHNSIVTLLENNGDLSDEEKANSTFYIDNDTLYLNLRAVVNKIKSELESAGIDFIPQRQFVDDEKLKIELTRIENLGLVVDGFNYLNTASIWLPIIFTLLIVAGLSLANRKRRAMYFLAIAILILSIINLLLIRAPLYFIESTEYFSVEEFRFIYLSVADAVINSLRVLALSSLAILLFMYLTGDSKVANAIRSWFTELTKNYKDNKFFIFVARYGKEMIYVAVILSVLLVLSIDFESPWPVFVIVIINGLFLLFIQSVRRSVKM